jgi:aromatic-L-amino-acid decarboxylase
LRGLRQRSGILMRSEEHHRRAFSEHPEYLKGAERGLAAGNPWSVKYGSELSRGFRALKVWA